MRTNYMGAIAHRNRPLEKWLALCALFVCASVLLTSCIGAGKPQEKQIVMQVVPNGLYVRTDGGKGTIEVNDAKVVIANQPMEERMIPYFSGNATLLDYQNNRYMGYTFSKEQTEEIRAFYNELFRSYDCNGEWTLVDYEMGSTVEEPLLYAANLKRDWKCPRETSPGFVRVSITYNYAIATLSFAGIDYIPAEFAGEDR